MGTITKTVNVRTCDLCNCREDTNDEVIRKCMMCGKDFCCQCGEIYTGQIGLEDYGYLSLCKDCLEKIVKYKDDDEVDEDDED